MLVKILQNSQEAGHQNSISLANYDDNVSQLDSRIYVFKQTKNANYKN